MLTNNYGKLASLICKSTHGMVPIGLLNQLRIKRPFQFHQGWIMSGLLNRMSMRMAIQSMNY